MKKQTILTNVLLALLSSLILSTGVFAQVKAWGSNYDGGQIGDGGYDGWRPSPTTLASLTDVIDIHGGSSHTLAVRANGTVLAWGSNRNGELGNGTITTTGCQCVPTPGAVSGLTNVVAVSAGRGSSFALKADGTVWGWGQNVGDGTTTNRPTPVRVGARVTGFSDIIAIDAGSYHSLALKSDGTLWAWGSNEYGQIGDGTSGSENNRQSPVQLTALGSGNIIAISAGSRHSMALTKTGRVYVWGENRVGQIGNGTAGADVPTPTLNTNITGVAQIQAGGFHNVALKPDGTVWAWGESGSGQIGNGATTTEYIPTPTQTTTLSNVTGIRAENSYHTLARKKDGSIWAWGHNGVGQMGNGTFFYYDLPSSPRGVFTPVQSLVGTGNVIFGTGVAHSLLSVPTVPTPAGTNVVVRLGDASAHFGSVIFNGANTTIRAIDPNSTGLTVPAGLSIAANNQAYHITSTAIVNNNVLICLNVTNEFDLAEFNKLRLLHGEGSVLADGTTSRNYQKREICATVRALNTPGLPFVLAKTITPTAAQVSISGRVLNVSGRGIARARVTIILSNGEQKSVLTNPLGYYSVDEIDAGAFVIITVNAKNYQFETSQTGLQATEDLTDINFTGTRLQPER